MPGRNTGHQSIISKNNAHLYDSGGGTHSLPRALFFVSQLNTRTGKVYYWEHLGMMENGAYDEGMVWRLNLYASNNIILGERLLLTYESYRNPISIDLIRMYISEYLS